MLILLGVGTKVAIDGKLFDTAQKAVRETNKQIALQESQEDDLMEELEDVTLVLSDYIKIGDYVAYQPAEVEEPYLVETKYSGGDNDVELSQESNLRWRVLTVDDKSRTIEIVSEKTIKGGNFIKGARGYNNCVYLLNDICKTLYSNPSYGAVARSQNIEDIESKMDLNVWDYHEYVVGNVKYGGEFTYRGNYLPKRYLEDVKTGGVSSKQDKLIAYESEEEAYTTKTAELIGVQGTWAQDNMKDKFISADTRNKSESNTMYDTLLIPVNNFFYLATRCLTNYRLFLSKFFMLLCYKY